MTIFLCCELTFASSMLDSACEQCHSERSARGGRIRVDDQNEIPPLRSAQGWNDSREGFSSILKDDVANDF